LARYEGRDKVLSNKAGAARDEYPGHRGSGST
jgi:hypothetical protein